MRPTNWPSSPAVASREPPDELGHHLGEALVASLRPPILDGDGAAFDPTEFAQLLHKGEEALAIERTRVGAHISEWSAPSPAAARAPRAATLQRRRGT
jgi:hypothetical protein